MGEAAVLLMGASTLYGYEMQKQAGAASEKYYQFLANQEDKNAQTLVDQTNKNAYFTQESANQQVLKLKDDQKVFNGTQKVAMAESGITGVTAEDIIGETYRKQEMDEMAIRYNADLKIYQDKENAKMQAYQMKQQANSYRYAGVAARAGANIQATGSLISGAAQTGITYAQLYPGSPSTSSDSTTSSTYVAPSGRGPGYGQGIG